VNISGLFSSAYWFVCSTMPGRRSSGMKWWKRSNGLYWWDYNKERPGSGGVGTFNFSGYGLGSLMCSWRISSRLSLLFADSNCCCHSSFFCLLAVLISACWELFWLFKSGCYCDNRVVFQPIEKFAGRKESISADWLWARFSRAFRLWMWEIYKYPTYLYMLT
jgi:hypothetical protein